MTDQQRELGVELVEVYQDLRYENGQWVFKVGVRLAGRVREGLGWGKTPEEAKRRAIRETLVLAPEGKELLEAIEKVLTPLTPQGAKERKEEGKEAGKEVSPEAPSSPAPTSPSEGGAPKNEASRSPFSLKEAMGKVVKALKERFPEAFYLALEEIEMGEKELQHLISLIEKGEQDEAVLEKARKIYGTLRAIYKTLVDRGEKPPRKELVVLVRRIVDSRFGEGRGGR
jgi:hypothetical protein